MEPSRCGTMQMRQQQNHWAAAERHLALQILPPSPPAPADMIHAHPSTPPSTVADRAYRITTHAAAAGAGSRNRSILPGHTDSLGIYCCSNLNSTSRANAAAQKVDSCAGIAMNVLVPSSKSQLFEELEEQEKRTTDNSAAAETCASTGVVVGNYPHTMPDRFTLDLRKLLARKPLMRQTSAAALESLQKLPPTFANSAADLNSIGTRFAAAMDTDKNMLLQLGMIDGDEVVDGRIRASPYSADDGGATMRCGDSDSSSSSRSFSASASEAGIAWRDLWVSVSGSSTAAGSKVVLHGLTGYAEAGKLLAIMGPSGCGKSTLLDALAGRLGRRARMNGDICACTGSFRSGKGAASTASSSSSSSSLWKQSKNQGIAYVRQEDTLLGTLTVRETLTYSAGVRLQAKEGAVEEAMEAMGLRECADTPVGNWHLRGLSGGEKRRLSIALEILTHPQLLFLDEPTSGLDSASAFFVITTLRRLARDGRRAIVASIHQPSSQVFALFDSLCLLSDGRLVFFGDKEDASQHFANAGFPCPQHRNPSDHYLCSINSDFDSVKSSLAMQKNLDVELLESSPDSNCAPLEKLSSTEMANILVDTYATSMYAHLARSRVDEFIISRQQEQKRKWPTTSSSSGLMSRHRSTGGGLISDGCNGRNSKKNRRKAPPPLVTQTWILTRRSFVNMRRDVGYYWLRLVIYILLTVCIGSIYFNIGTTFQSVMARASCISYVTGFLTFMSIGGFPSFVEDMKVFSREQSNGHYGVVPFVLANLMSALPYLSLIAVISSSICYFMVGLHPGMTHFVYFVLCLLACLAVVESLMMVVASIVPNFLMGIITGAGIQGIFMLVAGFFRLPRDMPKPIWRYPLSYLSFHMYAMQGMYQNDFVGLRFTAEEGGWAAAVPYVEGELILQTMYEVDIKRSKWWDLAILFAMVLVYRLIFLVLVQGSRAYHSWRQSSCSGAIARGAAKNVSSSSSPASPAASSSSPALTHSRGASTP